MTNAILEEFNIILSQNQLECTFRTENEAEWNEVCVKIPYLPVYYSDYFIDFQNTYFNSSQYIDLSLILKLDKKVVGLLPLSYKSSPKSELYGHGIPIGPPVFFESVTRKSRKSIIKKILQCLENFAKQKQITELKFADMFLNEFSGISVWHEVLIQNGAAPQLEYNLYVDLNLSMEQIKSYFRKSYKPLISSAQKLWNVQILETSDDYIWEEFRQFHIEVSGKETRSIDTWNLQKRTLDKKESFLINLRNEKGKMVGGGFFINTHTEGLYSVGVYDRNLFDEPLGHLVQYHAINVFKKRNLKWYLLGKRFFDFFTPKPTEKEISISEFKQGFATHIHPNEQFLLKINV